MDMQRKNLKQENGLYKFKNMDINKFNVTALQKDELRTIDGGWFQYVIPATLAIGAAMAWAFKKGEELGKTLA